MGTETKLTSYADTTLIDGILKLSKGSSNSAAGAAASAASNAAAASAARTTQKHWTNGLGSTSVLNKVVPFVPIHIDENDVIKGARDILAVIRPHWDLNAVQFKTFTDGITNKLVGCFNNQTDNTNAIKSNGNSENNSSTHQRTLATTNGSECANDDNNDSGNLSDSNNDDDDADDSAKTNASPERHQSDNVVLVRVYGNKTDLLIDRKAETRNFILLHAHGFAPSLYATFKNGLAYDYVPGVTLNRNSVQCPNVWRLVACRMAEMHRVINADKAGQNGAAAAAGAASESHVPMLWKKTHSFFDLVPERFSDPDKHRRLEGTFLPISHIRNEFVALYKRLETLGSPVVFAHNDLLLGNVIYTESRNMVNFIDYEYADYNFQAFDIGNHFAEFAGVDVVDYSFYPKREFQLEWLRVYLQTYKNCEEVSAAEVQRLYVQVNQFALAAHFFWTIWSLIQAEHSTIDFDYVDYAFMRYNEYLAKKEEFLALDINAVTS